MSADMQEHQSVLWIFFHLKKCGGTTLNGHFRKNLLWDEEFILYDRWGNEYREKHQRPTIDERKEDEKRHIKVISGHKFHYGIHKHCDDRPYRYLALMRDPADRIVSEYNFIRSRDAVDSDFHSWYFETYREKSLNFCVHYFAHKLMPIPIDFTDEERLSLAKKLFDRCWLILITDKFKDHLAPLFSLMNLPEKWVNYRVAGKENNRLRGLNHPKEGEYIQKYYTLDKDMRQCIYDDNPYDMALYDYALESNKRREHVLFQQEEDSMVKKASAYGL